MIEALIRDGSVALIAIAAYTALATIGFTSRKTEVPMRWGTTARTGARAQRGL